MKRDWEFRTTPDSPHVPRLQDHFVTRRQFLTRCGAGFGGLSVAALGAMGLLPGLNVFAADGPLAPRQPHFKPKAKRVLQIFAAGAPSHVDTWDPKPKLSALDGQTMPGDGKGV